MTYIVTVSDKIKSKGKRFAMTEKKKLLVIENKMKAKRVVKALKTVDRAKNPRIKKVDNKEILRILKKNKGKAIYY